MNAPIDRRHFLASMVATLTTAGLGAADDKRIPMAFSTLGCPGWSFKTVLKNAAEWGYAAVELRGLDHEMDLTTRPEFQPDRLETTLEELRRSGVKISDLGASSRMHEADPKVRAAQMDEGKRYIDLAQKLGAPCIRVFGDRLVSGVPREEAIARVVDGLKELGRYATDRNVSVLIESHGDFCDSPTLLEILEGVGLKNVGLVWDAHHTVFAGKETPSFTFEKLGRFVRHVHLKDSVPAGKDVRYVLTGKGNIPVRETVQVLKKHGFAGYLSFEWEKAWHPEIEEPEIAIPHFAKAMREYWEGA